MGLDMYLYEADFKDIFRQIPLESYIHNHIVVNELYGEEVAKIKGIEPFRKELITLFKYNRDKAVKYTTGTRKDIADIISRGDSYYYKTMLDAEGKDFKDDIIFRDYMLQQKSIINASEKALQHIEQLPVWDVIDWYVNIYKGSLDVTELISVYLEPLYMNTDEITHWRSFHELDHIIAKLCKKQYIDNGEIVIIDKTMRSLIIDEIRHYIDNGIGDEKIKDSLRTFTLLDEDKIYYYDVSR